MTGLLALKVIIAALGQQLGVRLWPPLMAWLHRRTWPRWLAVPWLAVVLAGPVWVCSRIYPRSSLLELLVVVSLPQCVGMAAIWGIATLASSLTRRIETRNVLPPDGDRPAPFLRRL